MGKVMENKSSIEFTLSFLLITALCLEAAIIERNLFSPAERMNWADARNYCQNNYIDLITWNEVVEPWLASWLLEVGVEQVWIGLHRDSKDSTVWRWINVETGKGISGDDFSQSPYWATGQQSSLCAIVKTDLLWYSEQCSNLHNLYCSQRSKTFFNPGSITWYEASLYCQVMNSTLATITSTSYDSVQDSGWIGLYRDADMNWKWIGNQPFIYSNWAKGHPLTPDCVSFKAANQKWYSNRCSSQFRFVCYDDNLVLVKENKTWEEALIHCEDLRIACDDLSGPCIYQHQLLSLQHLYDYSYVRNRIYTATTDEIWMGLRFLGGQWWWINGQELEDEGPDCPSPNERCGTLSKYDTDSWIARDCTERRNFICLRYMIHTNEEH
ncbi:macrophage mannose receptor 1-like [Channa argus]|uniref:macrophage mannose receptor 1-like n=1 Tax=Channa argus TaxID=215402 RepID=UPI0035206F22